MTINLDSEFAKLLQRLDFALRTKEVKTLSVFSEIEMEGKTHVILLLADHLQKIYSQKILIIDTDLEGDDLYDQCKQSSTSNPLIKKLDDSNVDLLDIVNFQVAMNAEDTSEVISSLSSFIDKNKNDYSLILIDTKSVDVSKSMFAFTCQADACVVIKSKKTLKKNKKDKIGKKLNKRKIPLMGLIYNQTSN